jgi:hypothetical protein
VLLDKVEGLPRFVVERIAPDLRHLLPATVERNNGSWFWNATSTAPIKLIVRNTKF